MAPLPENNTDRLWIDYTSVGVPHSAVHRFSGIDGLTTAAVIANALAEFYSGLLPTTDAITGARYSFADTNFSSDLGIDALAGDGTGATWLEDADAAFITLPGRGVATPNPSLLCFYAPLSFAQAWPTKNRYSAGQNSLWDGIREAWATAVLEPSVGVFLCNVAGDHVSLKSYLNFRKNGYRQTKQRRS